MAKLLLLYRRIAADESNCWIQIKLDRRWLRRV